jgi:hypothetical protein
LTLHVAIGQFTGKGEDIVSERNRMFCSSSLE